ncbi:MAG TPA: glycosyltransferase 87 family protein [Acidimicrobiales bacterium]|nr:glycosyltransferase 87 family protein [Acidimicrobiales bacterium]
MTSGLRAGAVRVVSSWGPEERDAVLYSACALFAICTAQTSSITLYQQWGRLATGPYLLGALLSALLARRARRDARVADAGALAGPDQAAELSSAAPTAPGEPSNVGGSWHWTTPRMVIFLLVLCGATLMPLSLEVLWRTDAGGTAHVQPEVTVVETAGGRLVHGQDQYVLVDGSRTHPSAPAGQPAYDVYNPYLPLMSAFGIPRSTRAPARLTDARVAFSLITILVVIGALALCRGPTGPRVVALQSMTVLPTAALPLATGGDDLPVAALLLFALVLMQRRRPLASGVALGLAASMKITAWPLAAIAFLGARDRDGVRNRRARLWLLGGMAGVMLPAILPTALSNVPAFLDNVVRFPLGLAGIQSPAATPLLGHVVVTAFPSLHRAFPLAVAAAGGAVLLWVLVRRTPRTPAALARVLAWAMTVAILLAPATRIGYFLYPIDFFVWAWLLRSEDGPATAVASIERPRQAVGAATG